MVNLTIVSGFLGAGKTTLLRQLIQQSLSRGERCTVIENEFGAVGLDSAVLARTGVPVHELNGGCVCCTLKASFADTLETILADTPPDRVFFEPSGIFIPDSLFETVRTANFTGRCRIAPFITVVDALAFATRLKRHGAFFERQAAFADILALTKTEYLDEGTLLAMQQRLREINGCAQQLVLARVDNASTILGGLLDGATRTRDRLASEQPSIRRTPAAQRGSPEFRRARTQAHGFELLSAQLGASMGIRELGSLLNELASGRFGAVIRAKGHLTNASRHVDFSLASGRIELIEEAPGDADTPTKNGSVGEIVVIGEALDKTELRRQLASWVG